MLRGLYSVTICMALLTFACNPSTDTSYDLKFSAKDFTPHNDQVLEVAIVRKSTGAILKKDKTVVRDGAFSFSFPGVLKAGEAYFVDYYADFNENGTCDAPQTDHTWRVRIPTVDGDVDFVDTHHMGFTDVCSSFTGEGGEEDTDTTTVTLVGTLAVDTSLAPTSGISPGALLSGSTVFIEGFPDVDAESRSDGTFRLQIPVPTKQAGGTLHAVMWHTVHSDGNEFKWDANITRIGKREAFAVPSSVSSQTVSLGKVFLSYTKRVFFTLREETTNDPVDLCWVQFPDYKFQLFFNNIGSGLYRVDYLPPGDYTMKLDCLGTEKLVPFTVSASTSYTDTQDLGTVYIRGDGSTYGHLH
ncbi:MAG: hypothetical protein HYW48_10785 [Deltaproteobacteria bacterium]|nr:hypothetical protein [Deltaproteobacteria bacterium]